MAKKGKISELDPNKQVVLHEKASGKRSLPAKQSNVQVDPSSPESMIIEAIRNKVDIPTMTALLAMRREFREERAKEAFYNDYAGLQSEMPIIEKNGKALNAQGRVLYYYARLEDITKGMKAVLLKYGFSYTFGTKQTPATVEGNKLIQATMTVICTVQHRGGYSKDTDFQVPIEAASGFTNSGQKTAGSNTFAKRYTLINAFGISTADDDVDGNTDNKTEVKTAHETPTAAVQTPAPHTPASATSVAAAVAQATQTPAASTPQPAAAVPAQQTNNVVAIQKQAFVITRTLNGAQTALVEFYKVQRFGEIPIEVCKDIIANGIQKALDTIGVKVKSIVPGNTPVEMTETDDKGQPYVLAWKIKDQSISIMKILAKERVPMYVVSMDPKTLISRCNCPGAARAKDGCKHIEMANRFVAYANTQK